MWLVLGVGAPFTCARFGHPCTRVGLTRRSSATDRISACMYAECTVAPPRERPQKRPAPVTAAAQNNSRRCSCSSEPRRMGAAARAAPETKALEGHAAHETLLKRRCRAESCRPCHNNTFPSPAVSDPSIHQPRCACRRAPCASAVAVLLASPPNIEAPRDRPPPSVPTTTTTTITTTTSVRLANFVPAVAVAFGHALLLAPRTCTRKCPGSVDQ